MSLLQILFYGKKQDAPQGQGKWHSGLDDIRNESYPALLGEMMGSHFEVKNFGRSGAGLWEGGAVDLTLCDEGGHPLDMGTLYLEHNAKTVTDCPDISEEQRRNQWWHFCYGDKMWAAYARKPYAIYGEVTPEIIDKNSGICDRFRLLFRLYIVTLPTEASLMHT